MIEAHLDQMVSDWFGLLDFCKSKEFDRVQFRARHDAWARSWSRLAWEHQGYISEMICEGLTGDVKKTQREAAAAQYQEIEEGPEPVEVATSEAESPSGIALSPNNIAAGMD